MFQKHTKGPSGLNIVIDARTINLQANARQETVFSVHLVPEESGL